MLQAQQASAAVSGVDALVAQRAEVEAQIAIAELNLEYTEVRAPFDGRVASLRTTVGQFASALKPVFTLIDTRHWYVVANFRETDLKGVRAGMPATVYLTSDTGKRFGGTIDSISYGVLPDDGGVVLDGLPRVARSINWVHVSQRFPVKIAVRDPDRTCSGSAPRRSRRSGATLLRTTRHGERGMSTAQFSPSRLQRFAGFIGGEIRPYPGRMNVMLRCVLASAIVIVASMALEVPLLAVSLIVVFFVTQANVVVTRLIGVLFVVGSTLAVGSSILVFKFTYDYPLLRILLAGALFFFSVYMMRVAKIGVVFFIVAIVVIYSQTFVDQTDQAELLVRAVLWVWVAVNYAIAVTLLINTLFLPAEPVRQLHAALCGQLNAVDARLAALEQRAPTAGGPTARDIQAGALTLQKLLRFATMRDPAYRASQALHLARVATVSRLYAAAGHLPGSATGSTADALRVLRDAVRRLADAAGTDARFVAPDALAGLAAEGLPGALAEMRDALLTFSDRSAAPPDAQSRAEKERMLVPDAVTNPVYAQFALKTLMAAMCSYVFYVATDWQGIHTMMLTCLIVAQPSLGASAQRAVLRIGGAAVGSMLALAMVVWVMPHLDGIVGLLMMTLPVIALAAWVSAGSERISYAGTQIMFTFSLAVLEHFGPTTNLTEIRDRMIGIVLGVVVSAVAHAFLWPEAEGEALRQRAAKLLRRIGMQLRPDTTGPVPVGLWAELGDSEAMSARVALEPGWQMADGEHEGLTLRVQTLLAHTREILLATDAFGAERDAQHLPAEVAVATAAFQAELAGALDSYADALVEHPLTIDAPPRASIATLSERCTEDLSARRGDASQTAYDRLLTRAGDLAGQIAGLPAWAPEPVASVLTSRASQA